MDRISILTARTCFQAINNNDVGTHVVYGTVRGQCVDE